jgi:hypothetical protein
MLFWRASGPAAQRWIARRVFAECVTVFNCSVLSFWCGNEHSLLKEPLERYNIHNASSNLFL